MCKHVAAVLYGVGARLDHTPELLFRLRAVDETELLAGIHAALPLSKTGPAAGKVLETDDISSLFGLDMAAPDMSAARTPSDIADEAQIRHTLVSPTTPGVPKRASAATSPAAKATPPRLPQQRPSVTAMSSSRQVVPEPATATTEVVGKRQKSVEQRGRRDADRAEANSASTFDALKISKRAPERRSASKGNAGTSRKPKPKPVKWW